MIGSSLAAHRRVNPFNLSESGDSKRKLAKYPAPSPLAVLRNEIHIQLMPFIVGSRRPGNPLKTREKAIAAMPPTMAPGAFVRRERTPSINKHATGPATKALS